MGSALDFGCSDANGGSKAKAGSIANGSAGTKAGLIANGGSETEGSSITNGSLKAEGSMETKDGSLANGGSADFEAGVRQDVRTLWSWIDACPDGGMVFFGGAGVSTESGIPDFRSADGVYAGRYPYPPETMVSHSFFKEHPREFFDFYFDRMIAPDAQPNAAHRMLAQLEREGKCRAVITQNIDGLHQKAGSENVIELHGSVHRNYCTGCGAFVCLDEMLELRERALAGRDGSDGANGSGGIAGTGAGSDGVPRCPKCGSIVKPDVVLYEEALDDETVGAAVGALQRAGLLVVAGTSLVVYPAAGLLRYFRGSRLAIVNLAPTSADRSADLCISAKVGEVLGARPGTAAAR